MCAFTQSCAYALHTGMQVCICLCLYVHTYVCNDMCVCACTCTHAHTHPSNSFGAVSWDRKNRRPAKTRIPFGRSAFVVRIRPKSSLILLPCFVLDAHILRTPQTATTLGTSAKNLRPTCTYWDPPVVLLNGSGAPLGKSGH